MLTAFARAFRTPDLRRKLLFVLLIVTTILLILAAGIQPLARVTIQRQKESELRHNLRDIREALDGIAAELGAARVRDGTAPAAAIAAARTALAAGQALTTPAP